MRIFEFYINPEDEEMGMKAISLVDKPAIESEFIAFNKQDKPIIFKFKDDKKYIIAGLALIPDKLIYRVDEMTEEEYMGYFSAETIEMIVDKFMKDAQQGTTKNVNLQHDNENKVQAHLVESFILRTPEMVEAVKAMGIEEAVLGAWFVSYKFENKEAYDNAVNGGFTGYSIEVILQRELKLNKNNDKNNNEFMTKVKNFIQKFKTLLEEIEGAGTFEDVVVPDSGKSLRIGEIGQPVIWVMIDEAGAEVTEPAMEGEYIIEDGRTVVVDAQGNLVEIKDAAVVAPIPEESLAEVPAPAEEAPAASGETEMPMVDVTLKTLGELVDVSKDGEYLIKCVVAGGKITEATVEANQNLINEADFNAVKAENETLKTEKLALEEKLNKIVVKPTFAEFSTPRQETLSKEEMKKMNNLQLTMHKLGLDK